MIGNSDDANAILMAAAVAASAQDLDLAARRIAASPDLAEALSKLVRWCNDLPLSGRKWQHETLTPNGKGWPPVELERAIAALIKAGLCPHGLRPVDCWECPAGVVDVELFLRLAEIGRARRKPDTVTEPSPPTVDAQTQFRRRPKP